MVLGSRTGRFVTPGVFLSVVAAGALGAVARARVVGAVERRWPRRGLGTLTVNLSGAFALGLWLGGSTLPFAALEIVGTGFLGAFTTFSTWMVEAVSGWREGRRWAVAVEVATTLLAGIGLLMAGAALGAAAGGVGS
jgi:fluoride exporter